MLAEAINQTAGIGIGAFLGCLLGLGIRVWQGRTGGLVRGSVLFTSVLAGMLAWTLAVAYALVVA